MSDILLVDDDQNLTQLLGEFLRGQGFTVRTSANGRDGLRSIFDRKPDLTVLDVNMPVKDGWETLKSIREISDVPIIMLTAHGDEADILRGFSLGADDYVAKPFSFAQLTARIQAVLVRSKGKDLQEQLVSGDLILDLTTCRVTREGEALDLTPTEFKLLTVLMRRAGQVVSPEDLVREVWGPQYKEEIGYVRRYVWHLRQKVEPDPENPRYIHNERGFGYRFEIK
jgi:two-component system KDP operon response regulator KdpE